VVVWLVSIRCLLVRFPKPQQQWIQFLWTEPLPAYQTKANRDLVPLNWTTRCMWNWRNTQFDPSDLIYFVHDKLERFSELRHYVHTKQATPVASFPLTLGLLSGYNMHPHLVISSTVLDGKE
jgi:hypothetical protein